MEPTEEPKEEKVKMNFPGINPPKPEDIIAKATAAAERLEKANADMKALVEEQRAISAEQILGGSTIAGRERKPKTAEEIETEEARKLLAGTGFEDELFPKKPNHESQ